MGTAVGISGETPSKITKTDLKVSRMIGCAWHTRLSAFSKLTVSVNISRFLKNITITYTIRV